jgi:hypothetical protein
MESVKMVAKTSRLLQSTVTPAAPELPAPSGNHPVSTWEPPKPKQITFDDINTPLTWACVDCGVNTAPGMMTRQEIYEALQRNKANYGGNTALGTKTIDSNSEIYTVRQAVWQKAGMPADGTGGCLCVGCIEKRLGRKLKPKDFKRDDAFAHLPGTPRLLERRGYRVVEDK